LPLHEEDRASAECGPWDFDGLYHQYVEQVARWAARLGGASVDVDDVVQEVFVAVHRQLGSFRGECHVKTWLFRITANQVGERRRRERWRRWLSGSADEVTGHLVSPHPSPIEALERREAAQRIYRALDAMNERARTLVILFEIERLSGHEIAELTGMKIEAVWVALHRARAQLVERLGREEVPQ
jgi:RNA polymerase sigma-70 factor (ECF subfamily)